MGFLGLGGNEVLIILVAAALLFFGARKIPEFAKSLGRAMGEFKKGRLEVEKEIQESGITRPMADDASKAFEK